MGKSKSLPSISVFTCEKLGSVIELHFAEELLAFQYAVKPHLVLPLNLLSWVGLVGSGELIYRELSIGECVSSREIKETGVMK